MYSWIIFNFQGSKGHYGTYQSIIYGIASEREGNLKNLRKELFSKPMPKFGPKLARRFVNLLFHNFAEFSTKYFMKSCAM